MRADEPRLALDRRIEGPGRVPQGLRGPCTTAVIPDARDNRAARPGDASHLPHAGCRVGHEVDDELRESSIERVVRERQLLRGAEPDVDARVACASGLDERLRRIDRGDRLGADPRRRAPW